MAERLSDMLGAARIGVINLWLHWIASVAVGAWISPLAYNAGKALAEISSVKQTNDSLEWLAGVCRTSEFPRFFVGSVAICAVLFFLPLFGSLRTGFATFRHAHPLKKNHRWLSDAVIGFLGTLLVIATIAGLTHLFTGTTLLPFGKQAVWQVGRLLLFAIGWALIQELWFFGVSLGVCLRAMPRAPALCLTAAYFALTYLLSPPAGMNVVDSEVSGIGFELLGKIFTQLANPYGLMIAVLPWLTLGGMLGALRLRTASLWLPLGIHSGWIFGHCLLRHFPTSSLSPLTESLISIASLILIALVAYALTPPDAAKIPRI